MSLYKIKGREREKEKIERHGSICIILIERGYIDQSIDI